MDMRREEKREREAGREREHMTRLEVAKKKIILSIEAIIS
jgi:hypothetical protein